MQQHRNSCRCLVSSLVSGAGARIDTAAPAAVSTDLLDVVEPAGPITQLEFELRRLQRALHQLEQTREPIRLHLLAQSLLARPVLNVRDAHRIERFARQEQLTTHAAPFTPRGHHQRAKAIDQTPRLAAGRGYRQRQVGSRLSQSRLRTAPSGEVAVCGSSADTTFTRRDPTSSLSAQGVCPPEISKGARNVGAGLPRRPPRTRFEPARQA